ncbi:MAG TPA: Na/Pi symporter, partial [Nitrosomonas nitrosa]|nr:Na/Pi symporter [Nitrosomonas nitrosa]
MTALFFQLFGGIGLFLMGMVLLTDGLKAVAGDALRGALVRFTGTPYKAFVSGALVTLMVQSSTATTVTLIGFVSAGLLTFPQAVGVVLGASLGTTGTGWMVSMLGLKVSLGFYALPLVGIGALLRLLTHGRWRSSGLALAGFGLIFVGIDHLQNGMQVLAGAFDLTALPSTGVIGHLIATVIGVFMTVVMQSSSAAVATTLTALHANVINFEQAASLVIGAAIGTTI